MAYVKAASAAVVLVVLADSLMTFFGSTANDAAFNAWTADIASSDQRGRVEGVLNLAVFIAQIVAMVAAGMLIDRVGYFIFFYSLGAIVLVVGLIAGTLLREPPAPPVPADRPPFWAEFKELFSLETLRQNRELFILLIFIMITSIGMQVSFPYMIVYLENYVGVSKTEFSVIGGAVMVGSALLAVSVQVRPRPLWAIFSPDFQSPRYLPSAGQRTVFMLSASSSLARSGEIGWPATSAASQAASVGSLASASLTLTMPLSWKDSCTILCVSASSCAGFMSAPDEAPPAQAASRAVAPAARAASL